MSCGQSTQQQERPEELNFKKHKRDYFSSEKKKDFKIKCLTRGIIYFINFILNQSTFENIIFLFYQKVRVLLKAGVEKEAYGRALI